MVKVSLLSILVSLGSVAFAAAVLLTDCSRVRE